MPRGRRSVSDHYHTRTHRVLYTPFMRPLPRPVIDLLDLESAISAEATFRRDLLPEEPGWQALFSNQTAVAEWLRSQLQSAYLPSREVIIGARKAGHGVRPVAVLQMLDRVIYRALVSQLISGRPPTDRSAEEYLDFVLAPIMHAIESRSSIGSNAFSFAESDTKYVVKTDISAFYQYIDHEVLANELILQTGKFDIVEALIDFLSDIQGRKFGLPQQLYASMELSEYYIDIVERRMTREGYDVWRFNDDFRISATSYPHALRAIDRVSAIAGELGMVINEQKTITPSFSTYLMDNTDISVDDEVPTDIVAEDAVGDYLDAVDPDNLDVARSRITGARPDSDAEIDIRKSNSDDVRALRRALAAFRLAADPEVAEDSVRLIAYIAAITPDIIEYLVALNDSLVAGTTISQIITNVSLNEWQELWIVDALRRMQLLDSRSTDALDVRIEWVRNLILPGHSPLVRAHSFWALSNAGLVGVPEVETAMRDAPSALTSWYLSSLNELIATADTRAQKIISAVKRDSRLGTWLLP